MSASQRRALPAVVTFRVTPAQAEALAEVAKPLSAGQWVRQVALATAGIVGPAPGRRPLARVRDAELLRAALAELGHIGGNINQLAHWANMGHAVGSAAIEAIRADLLPVRDQIIAALGRGGEAES